MNDRELIELAAKASGMAGGWGEVQINAGQELDMTHMWFLDDDSNCPIWNPLEDDGDALRLASKLWLCIEFGYSLDDSPVVRCGHECNREEWKECPAYPDRNSAIRRAIVRVAAAIGQSMP